MRDRMDAHKRMPLAGEGWRERRRHTLWEVVGTGAHSLSGDGLVVLKRADWSFVQSPLLMCVPLNVFLGIHPDDREVNFYFEREAKKPWNEGDA